MNPDALMLEARQLLAASRHPEAVAKYEQVVRLVPDHPLPRAELALAYTQVNRLDEAEALARNVLRSNPDLGVAEAALGLTCTQRFRPDLAIEHLARAVQLAPDLIIARQMLGLCYSYMGRPREAAACYETVTLLQPNHPNARFSLGMHRLYERDYTQGWHEYEWRWLTNQLTKPEIPRPRWDGRDLTGQSILVHTEQGIGDAVQLVRLLPLLKSQKNAARLVFACQKAIHKLLENSVEVDEWFPIDTPASISFDTFTPMLALPALLGINEHNLPKPIQYVKPDPLRVAKWRPILDAIPGFKIGIGWQGSPTYLGDSYRSIPLHHFKMLADLPGVTLVCLQKLNGLEQIEKSGVPVRVLEGLDDDAAFVDTAAVLPLLNLTIACDSALGHIAGAVGVPAFAALSLGHDWRWQAVREDSPWYPRTRVFRQTSFQHWPGVFERMAAVIRAAITDKTALAPPRSLVALPPRVEIQVGELFDKISILEIKQKRIADKARLENVHREWSELTAVRDKLVPASIAIDDLVKQLDEVNLAIWDNEERMRAWAKAEDFGAEYVAGARSIAKNNDRRAALKRSINDLLGSRLVEEKSYNSSNS